MRHRVLFALIFLISFNPSYTFGQDNTLSGLELGNHCREVIQKIEINADNTVNIPDTALAGICFGVFLTWQDLYKSVAEGMGDCIDVPQGVTATQLIFVFDKYLTENPARAHEDWDMLIYDSFLQAWPC